ncbi:hypothetical protein D9Q98_002812 [Chlorella vulgaris]|uniref:Uncharacterized protein n=1 Tax=Chlorella vulgaris TaxID=3077 RepID=A0A9D4YZ72_CHLVU|nr:hypothetical protein D9Q98_002812 [Chlorella vulgaris]
MSGAAARVASEWAKGWPRIVRKQRLLEATQDVFVHRIEGDFITSKAIPLALSAAGVALVVPGVVKMALGIHE